MQAKVRALGYAVVQAVDLDRHAWYPAEEVRYRPRG